MSLKHCAGLHDDTCRLVFMLGESERREKQEDIIREAREHGDIVQGSFRDTYRNLTYKTVMGHVWVR